MSLNLANSLAFKAQSFAAKCVSKKKQQNTNIWLTNISTPNILSVNHVVSAQERGLPGQGEIAEVPTFYPLAGSMAQENPVTVEIYNQTYRLGTSEDRNAEYIQRAAAYLDEKMQQAASEVGNRAPLDIAILAALNIAEEVLNARSEKDSLLGQADAQIDSFTQLLSDTDSPNDSPPTETKRF